MDSIEALVHGARDLYVFLVSSGCCNKAQDTIGFLCS